MRRSLAIGLLLAGCIGHAPTTDETTSATPTAWSWDPSEARVLVPTDAAWPSVEDAAALSRLYPVSLRLETRWEEAVPPTNATLLLWVAPTEHTLPARFELGSAAGFAPSGSSCECLSYHLEGGLRALADADPMLVTMERVRFAGVDVDVPTLTKEARLKARVDTANGIVDIPLRLLPREAGTADKPFYQPAEGRFGMLPHPGGSIHALEDAALLAWADDERLLAIAPQGELPPPGPPALDLLVLTGMTGSLLRVAGE